MVLWGSTLEPSVTTDRRTHARVGLATILVVDDSSAVRGILRRNLERVGYRVREAADGVGALGVCRTERPDLVLLDFVLDGALGAIRRHADIPVLFLGSTTGAAAVGLRLGAQDWIRKPVDSEELIARVANALQLRNRSDIDLLTGLPNRRWLERAPEGDVILIDVDDFKAINDTEGHLIGDVVLRILAARLRSVTGEHLLVRWGGDEFVVIGDGDLGERLLAAVTATPFAITPGRVLPVTVSIGCGPTLERADEALYVAKRAGRNRVVVNE